jgi:hypothetical protein
MSRPVRLLTPPAVGPKYYCPGCGEVRHTEAMGPLRIKTHLTGSSSVRTEDDLRRRCPGGPVDREKDKAP